MHHTAPEHIRLLIPYIGKDAKYYNFDGDSWDMEITADLIYRQAESIRPYLKPLTASRYGDMARALHYAWEETKHIPYDEIQVCVKWAKAMDVLRFEGYDCDRLIEQGLALLHPDYDIKDLL